jgi:signal transduction histidine kinase
MGSLVDSTTVRRLCVSSPTDHGGDRTLDLRLVGALTEPNRRAIAAQTLARHVGADAMLVFLFDPEVDAYLPAPGFVQTLPDGRVWQQFLRRGADEGCWTGELPFPESGAQLPALGVRGAGDAVLVLLGGAPRGPAVADLARLLPLLAHAFQGEWTAQSAQAQVTLLRRAATEAQTLAEGLAAARRELERLYGEVRAALDSRDAFLSSVTHDLRTPLTTITGYVQLLQRQVRRTQPAGADRLTEGLRQLELTGTRMRRQVDQLLDVARLQLGQPLELERRPTDLVALARAACREHQVNSDHHQVVLEAREERLVGMWDALRLERLLDNLLGNAIKYSPDGGEVRVTVGQEAGDGAQWAVLTVRDPGIGVPEEEVAHIFDRFYRAGNTGREMTGSGIGLASARQIVQDHGGTIGVATAVGKGSVFTVRLPLGSTDDGAA